MTNKEPNSRMCFICGLKNSIGLHIHIDGTGPGVVKSTYLAPDHFQVYPGVLYGGMVATIVDEIVGRSPMGSDLSKSRFMFKAKMEVKYRKQVPIGKAGRSKSNSAEAWAGIYDADTDELLAEGKVMLIYVTTQQFDGTKLAGRYILNNHHIRPSQNGCRCSISLGERARVSGKTPCYFFRHPAT